MYVTESSMMHLCQTSAATKCPIANFHHIIWYVHLRQTPQPRRASLPMYVTASGMLTCVKLLQPWKVSSPMYVTASGMFPCVKLLHPRKASLPMCATASGMFTCVKFLHPENAPSPISVIEGTYTVWYRAIKVKILENHFFKKLMI